MNAAIIKRGRRYAVRLDLGRGPDGRRIYKYHSGYPTRKAAQQARTELLGALDRRSYVAPDKTTVAEYLRGQWLPAIQTRVRPGTWVEYRRKAETHLIPALGQIPLQQLTTAILNAHYQQLLARGTGPRTVQYVHATIRKALNDAVRWGLLVRNPALLRRPTQPPPPRAADLDRRGAAPVPATASKTTGCTPPGGWPPSPACAAAKSSGCAGPTSTWTPAGSRSARP